MSQVNPDPHDAGYVYAPTHAVTADFPQRVDIAALQQSLKDAGFGADQLQVFQGEEGADQLDLKGERQGGWVRFRRQVERALADETVVFDQVDKVLRSGGAVAAAFTGGDDARKTKAVEVLRSYGGQVVRYWSGLTIERL